MRGKPSAMACRMYQNQIMSTSEFPYITSGTSLVPRRPLYTSVGHLGTRLNTWIFKTRLMSSTGHVDLQDKMSSKMSLEFKEGRVLMYM